MTDGQREQARKARDEYAAYLRKWETFVRSGEAYKPVDISAIQPSRADIIADWIAFSYGDFATTENTLFQMFRAYLDQDKPELLKEFDARRDRVRRAFEQYGGEDDEHGRQELADALMVEAVAVEVFDFGTDRETTPDLLKDLAPESKKADAIRYCARLVCHVWNTDKHGGKRKATDYVFVKAKEGESLFGDCRYARTLVEKWGISTGGIMTSAATMHAAQSGGKHIKADGMERPETIREAAKKSRAAEQAERKRKAEHGARRSGKKR